MVFLTVLFVVKGMDDGRYFYPMGICMGLSYYAKGAGLVLIPAYILFYLVCRPSLKGLMQDKKFLHGLGLTLLILLPWFIRNTIHFHNPIFSTQQFSSGYIGYESWETGTYSLYWGENLPSFFTKLKRGAGFVAKMTWQYFKSYLWWAFVDIRQGWGKFQSKDFYTYITGIPAAFGMAMLLISSLYLVLKKIANTLASPFLNRKPENTGGKFYSCASRLSKIMDAILLPWQNRLLHIVWLVILTLFLFLSLCWSPINRLTFPATALIITTGWAVCYLVLKSFLDLNKYLKRYSNVIIAILLLSLVMPIVGYSGISIYRTSKTSGYPYREGGEAWMTAGHWLKANAPDSVTMTRNPWELHFYSEEKAIQIPLAELDKIIQIAKFYGATHLIPYNQRPALNTWINGEIAGLRLVYDNMGLQIYEIHYELLPDKFR